MSDGGGSSLERVDARADSLSQANWADSECHACGNVNPEQIFNIVESLVIDEYGKETRTRKISPEEWYSYFVNSGQPVKKRTLIENLLPSIAFKVPGLFKQLRVFVTRDVPVRLFVTGASKNTLCIMMDSFQVRKQLRSQRVEEKMILPSGR